MSLEAHPAQPWWALSSLGNLPYFATENNFPNVQMNQPSCNWRHLFFAVSSCNTKKSLVLSFIMENCHHFLLTHEMSIHGLFATFMCICNFFSIAIFHTYTQDFLFLDGEYYIKIILCLFMSFTISIHIYVHEWDKMLQSKAKKTQTLTIYVFLSILKSIIT